MGCGWSFVDRGMETFTGSDDRHPGGDSGQVGIKLHGMQAQLARVAAVVIFVVMRMGRELPWPGQQGGQEAILKNAVQGGHVGFLQDAACDSTLMTAAMPCRLRETG